MRKIKWTLEKIQEKANRCKSRRDFVTRYKCAYKAAVNRGILDEVCTHMTRLIRKNWTYEEMIEEALKYKTRKEFKVSSPAYQIAIKRNLLDQICSHMPKRADQSGKNSPVFKWTLEKIQEEALKYKTRNEFCKNSSAYQAARYAGCLDDVCSHMVRLVRKAWTYKEIIEEAKKYNTRTDFEKLSNSAYSAASKLKILDQVCSHMEYKYSPWTDKELTQEALKYNTRSEFRKNSGAYTAARNRGILDEICTHMKIMGGTSKPEIALFDIIKAVYPKTQKLNDNKVKIEGKPHIQGFKLDIYVPELRKGIEFDGKYWHSVPGLKRSREHWPEKDLVNYHELKDQWFSSKGIKLLHIKHEDWNGNPQACINKCLEFLTSNKDFS